MTITFVLILFPVPAKPTDGQTDRTDKLDRKDMTVRTYRQTDRQANRQTHTHTLNHCRRGIDRPLVIVCSTCTW